MRAGSARLLVLHEHGEALTPELLSPTKPTDASSEITPELRSPTKPTDASSEGSEDCSSSESDRRSDDTHGRTVFVLGDHLGFTDAEEQCMAELGGLRVSVSPLPLLASHCIVLAHAALDAAMVRASPRPE